MVKAEGIQHNRLMLGHHEIFARITFNREWDVRELSFAKFVAKVTRQDSDIVDEHGVGLKDVHWVQAGANEAGRKG